MGVYRRHIINKRDDQLAALCRVHVRVELAAPIGSAVQLVSTGTIVHMFIQMPRE